MGKLHYYAREESDSDQPESGWRAVYDSLKVGVYGSYDPGECFTYPVWGYEDTPIRKTKAHAEQDAIAAWRENTRRQKGFHKDGPGVGWTHTLYGSDHRPMTDDYIKLVENFKFGTQDPDSPARKKLTALLKRKAEERNS